MRAWPLLLVLAVGCDRKNPHGDMKPADTWDDPQAPGTGAEGLAPPTADLDENEGLPPGHPDIGGGGGGDMGGGGDPHGDMNAMAPDPDRPIDASKFLRGGITLGSGVKMPATGVMFMAVRTPGPDGKPAEGSFPLAVDIIEPIPTFPFAFDLHEGKAMINGTTFVGDVLVIARIDQDGDVDTKQPGDLYGQVRATIPAGDLLLTLEATTP